MLTITESLICLLNLLLFTAATQNPPPYTPTDQILLNLGASSDGSSQDGRKWEADVGSKFCPFDSQASSVSALEQDPSVEDVPYMTARIFSSKFACTFPVSPGPKFIRLYFYVANYSSLNQSTSFLTVVANNYTLLSNFSAYLTASALRPARAYLVKEFIVPVWDKQQLNIISSPSSSSSPAFINGIEIVSMPNNLYTTEAEPPPYKVVNSNFDDLGNSTSLETLYRLDVGGGYISNVGDTGMFRTWMDDSDYIFGAATGMIYSEQNFTPKYTNQTPPYVAPDVLYQTYRKMGIEPQVNLNYNLTWYFSVDSGFSYLVRLHFCETNLTLPNQRVFYIYINNMTAEYDADVINWSGGIDTPVYKDYVVWIPSEGQARKQYLWLALHPNIQPKPQYWDAILNGLEILKLNNSEGSLAGLNPELPVDIAQQEPQPSPRIAKSGKRSSLIAAIVGAGAGASIVISVVICFVPYQRRKASARRHKSPDNMSTSTTSTRLPTHLCRRFTLIEIKAATANFDNQNIIGSGGFGTVYKGYIEVEGGSIPVAIKRLDSLSKQGTREFHTEIQMLSRLRHVHLVSLIGYCDDRGEKAIVYEYMPNGTLKDHLYKTKSTSPPLPWKKRLEICLGAARGLHYLHTGVKPSVIHRDVKSSNILLDENWAARVSDFGLSKLGPTSTSHAHVTTLVRGSIGYVDPEYFRRQQLSEKSDVYSFGVVLLEAFCARAPVMSTLPKEQVNLAQWARDCREKGNLHQVIDPSLRHEIDPGCLKKIGEIADSCIRDRGNERPTMGDVVGGLEFALQLQVAADNSIDVGGLSVDECQTETSGPRRDVTTTTTTTTTDDDDGMFSVSDKIVSDSRSTISTSGKSVAQNEDSGFKSEAVFSEILHPGGR